MADRLYCVRQDEDGHPVYVIFDFEARKTRHVKENPHPEDGNDTPPFYADQETFWAIVGRIRELDEKNQRYTRRSYD